MITPQSPNPRSELRATSIEEKPVILIALLKNRLLSDLYQLNISDLNFTGLLQNVHVRVEKTFSEV